MNHRRELFVGKTWENQIYGVPVYDYIYIYNIFLQLYIYIYTVYIDVQRVECSASTTVTLRKFLA